MALTLSKKNPRGIVGLDLDGAFLAAVQAGGGRISRAASTELPPGVITDGEVTDVEGLSRRLQRPSSRQNALPTASGSASRTSRSSCATSSCR